MYCAIPCVMFCAIPCVMFWAIPCIMYYRQEFDAHGLSDVVTLECRDVCRDGFGVTGLVDAGV